VVNDSKTRGSSRIAQPRGDEAAHKAEEMTRPRNPVVRDESRCQDSAIANRDDQRHEQGPPVAIEGGAEQKKTSEAVDQTARTDVVAGRPENPDTKTGNERGTEQDEKELGDPPDENERAEHNQRKRVVDQVSPTLVNQRSGENSEQTVIRTRNHTGAGHRNVPSERRIECADEPEQSYEDREHDRTPAKVRSQL